MFAFCYANLLVDELTEKLLFCSISYFCLVYLQEGVACVCFYGFVRYCHQCVSSALYARYVGNSKVFQLFYIRNDKKLFYYDIRKEN